VAQFGPADGLPQIPTCRTKSPLTFGCKIVCGLEKVEKEPTFSLADELALPLPFLLASHQQFPFLRSPEPVAVGLYAEKVINMIVNKILFVGLFLYTFFLQG
jgi:hypothetical protein